MKLEDRVIVIEGPDIGRSGTVTSVDPVFGINVHFTHPHDELCSDHTARFPDGRSLRVVE